VGNNDGQEVYEHIDDESLGYNDGSNGGMDTDGRIDTDGATELDVGMDTDGTNTANDQRDFKSNFFSKQFVYSCILLFSRTDRPRTRKYPKVN
jgi:hypothetical protein